MKPIISPYPYPNWMVLLSMPLARRSASTPRQTPRVSVPPVVSARRQNPSERPFT